MTTGCQDLTRLPLNPRAVPADLITELLVTTLDKTVGTRVNVSCVPGLILQGPSVVECLSSRAWSAYPSCRFPVTTTIAPTVVTEDDSVVMMVAVGVVILCVTLFILVVCFLVYRNRKRQKEEDWSDKHVYKEESESSFSDINGYERDNSFTNRKYLDMPRHTGYNSTLTKQYVNRYASRGPASFHGRTPADAGRHISNRETARHYDDLEYPHDNVTREQPRHHSLNDTRNYSLSYVSNTYRPERPASRHDQDGGVSYIYMDRMSRQHSPFLWRGLPMYIGSMDSWSISRPIYDH